MPKGYLFLVLHAHLPYVRHPEYDRFLEERWFFEAVTETYIPLIKFFDKLKKEGTPFKLTLSVSPPLANMMEDPLLQQRVLRHLEADGSSRVRSDGTAYDTGRGNAKQASAEMGADLLFWWLRGGDSNSRPSA